MSSDAIESKISEKQGACFGYFGLPVFDRRRLKSRLICTQSSPVIKADSAPSALRKIQPYPRPASYRQAKFSLSCSVSTISPSLALAKLNELGRLLGVSAIIGRAVRPL